MRHFFGTLSLALFLPGMCLAADLPNLASAGARVTLDVYRNGVITWNGRTIGDHSALGRYCEAVHAQISDVAATLVPQGVASECLMQRVLGVTKRCGFKVILYQPIVNPAEHCDAGP